MTEPKKSDRRRGAAGLMTAGSALAILAALCLPAFAADDETKAEIKALKAQLRRLEQKLEAQTENQKKTEQEVQRVAKAKAKAGSEAPDPSKDGDYIWPAMFHYKAVTITPGGFFEFATIHRDHFIGADLATPFGQIPYPNNPSSHSDETRFTPRRSRFILQTDADLDAATHAKMYLAADFLSAAQTATLTQSDSFNFRFRELYLKLDKNFFGPDFVTHVSAGQMYTLASLNSRGTTPDTFLTPPVIDDQYMPGYTWARQPGVRLSQNFGKDVQLAFGAEAAYVNYATPGYAINGLTGPAPYNSFQLVPGASAPSVYIPGAYTQAPVSGSLYNSLNAVTFNDVPDLMTKAAWDPEIYGHQVHVEGGGMLRNFNDRTYGGNHDVWAGSGLVGVIVSVVPKLIDFQVSGLSGTGNGRYGSASLADATFDWTGAPQPIHERQAMIGVIGHVTPQTDVYVFAGGEFAAPRYNYADYPSVKGFSITPGLYSYGYGNPAYVNLGCNFEGSTTAGGAPYATCVGQTKDVRQITTGFWHDFYNGPAGKLRVGAQYSYTIRDSFQGVGGAFKGTENMIFTSLRYYPFN
jgi:hypothetical protein